EALAHTMRNAIRKNDDPRSWERFNVIVAGGGSNIPELRSVFTKSLPHPYVKSVKERAVRLANARVVGHSSRLPAEAEAFELLSVLGSTRPVWEEVEFSASNAISTVVPVIEDPLRELSKVRYMRWV